MIHEARRLRAPLHRPSKSVFVETVQTWSSQLHRAAAERTASRALTKISVACWPYGCRRLSVSLGRMLGGRHAIQLRNRRCLTGVSPSSRRTATLVWPHPLNGDVQEVSRKCSMSTVGNIVFSNASAGTQQYILGFGRRMHLVGDSFREDDRTLNIAQTETYLRPVVPTQRRMPPLL